MAEATMKPLVLVISGSGRTGVPILTGLAKSGAWRLAATVRPASIDKPEVTLLRELGVEIRPTDWQKDGPAKLDELFSNVEVVISTCNYITEVLLDQKLLVDAAKRANVKRFIPCDFGTPAPRGVMVLLDTKLQVRDYVKEQGVPYTFIDVGFWMEVSVPHRSSSTDLFAPLLRGFYGDGETKSGLTNRDHIGDFVARIIADPRTLNQYVYAHEVEVTQNEIYEICGRIAGEDFHTTREMISGDELLARRKQGGMAMLWSEYQYSIYIRGDNCVKSAKSLGALDTKELYPDMYCQTLVEFAEEFYAAKDTKASQ